MLFKFLEEETDIMTCLSQGHFGGHMSKNLVLWKVYHSKRYPKSLASTVSKISNLVISAWTLHQAPKILEHVKIDFLRIGK